RHDGQDVEERFAHFRGRLTAGRQGANPESQGKGGQGREEAESIGAPSPRRHAKLSFDHWQKTHLAISLARVMRGAEEENDSGAPVRDAGAKAGGGKCAGKAQRRRRFECAGTPGRASQSGVALRLPPHSKIAGDATECSPSHGPLSISSPPDRSHSLAFMRGTDHWLVGAGDSPASATTTAETELGVSGLGSAANCRRAQPVCL